MGVPSATPKMIMARALIRPILILFTLLGLGAADPLGPPTLGAKNSRRVGPTIQDLPTANCKPITLHHIGFAVVMQQVGLDYQVPASAGTQVSDWVVYNFTVVQGGPTVVNYIDVIMDRVSAEGDPDLYLFKVGEDEAVASDLNTEDHGMHQIRYAIPWSYNSTDLSSFYCNFMNCDGAPQGGPCNASPEACNACEGTVCNDAGVLYPTPIDFLIGVQAWGTTPANFTLNAFETSCATGLDRGVPGGTHDAGAISTRVYPKVCGNPYEPSGMGGSNPEHGLCKLTGQCECYDASDHPAYRPEASFVGIDCTGMASPYPIYPPTAGHDDFQELYVSEGFDVYYNITLTAVTYELIVDMAVADSSYNRAVMSIGIDRYTSGETVYEILSSGDDFYPLWPMQNSRHQQIKLSRSDDNTAYQQIHTNGNYVIRIHWTANDTATHETVANAKTKFSLAVTANECPNQCSNAGLGPSELPKGTCDSATHTCQCTKGYYGLDCSESHVPLVPTVLSILGASVRPGVGRSDVLSGGAHAIYKLDTSFIGTSMIQGPAELRVQVVAQQGNQSEAAFGFCNSIPKITVKQGTPDLSPSAAYPVGGCVWPSSFGNPRAAKTWTETSMSCASQFQVDTEHTEWYVTVLASGSGEMAFTVTTTIMQQPSAAHYQNISKLMKQWHNDFNNESEYSGDLVKEIKALMARSSSSGSSSGVSAGAVVGICIATFALGALAMFGVAKFTGVLSNGKPGLSIAGDHSLLDAPATPSTTREANELLNAGV